MFEFTDEEKAVYEYHDGTGPRCADPLALRRKMLRLAGGDMESLVEAATEAPGATEGVAAVAAGEARARLMRQQDAQEKLAAIIREAFGLAPFDPATKSGCTEAMCWRVWDHFHEWLEKNESRADG